MAAPVRFAGGPDLGSSAIRPTAGGCGRCHGDQRPGRLHLGIADLGGIQLPDSEFYASLALFGNDVADRSLDPAYTWTRLGYIAPVRLLVTTLDPWVGFALWRLILIVVIVGSLYAVVRLAGTRELAIIVAGLASLNTMVLSYVGNPYLTGSIIAATVLLLALGAWEALGAPRRVWLPAALSGLVAGWLVMLNPYALMLAMSMWVAIRVVRLVVTPEARWRALGRDALVGIGGFAAAFSVLVLAGTRIFPGRNWFTTYLEWNSRLDYASFVGDATVWQRDVALLVPLGAVLIAVTVVVATRASTAAVTALAIGSASIAFTWGYVALVPGPWLEAPHYVAKLWSGALVAFALAIAALVGRRRLGPAAWITSALAVPFVLWAGRWDTDLPRWQGLAVLATVLAAVAVAALLLRRRRSALGSVPIPAAVAVAVAVCMAAIGAQVLQNGRGLLGIYGQYPFRAAYVDFDGELLMRSKVEAEEFVLAQTGPDDSIAIWTDPDRLTAAVAAMQLWGKYNNISAGDVIAGEDLDRLRERRPTAIAMYAPHREQIDTLWSSLPPDALASPPQCTSVPYLGIGSPEAHVCVTHLRWAG